MIRVALEALLESPEEMEKLSRLLSGGAVFAIPTDTFYGLAAHPANEAGVSKVFAAKGRDDGKPLPVVAGYVEQIESLGISAAPALSRLSQLWPAPLTAVLPLREPIAASRGLRSLAVRIPADERLRGLLAETGPLTATSANRSGHPPAVDPATVVDELSGWIDVLVDGGACPGGMPSTIVDFTQDPPRLLREGAFPWPSGAPPGGRW
ncbi:MAG TPA: L-threonylcarbamoyladenylate synthase [Thermoanaerobaculia bacterium]|jgi:L-threonylcarbamoyladenylate synthase